MIAAGGREGRCVASSWRPARLIALILLALFCLLISPIEAKRVTGSVTVVSNRVNKIAKFSFRPVGVSVISGTFTYRGAEPRGTIYLFVDTEWEQFHGSSDECTRMSKATAKINIGTNVHEGKGWTPSLQTTEIKADTHMFNFTWNIQHYVRTYGYYLVVADCHQSSHKRFKVMDYDISFFNDGTDHFPADEHGLFTLYVICFLGLGAVAYQQFAKYRKKNTYDGGFRDGPPPAATTLLIAGYCTELVSILFELLHLWWYGYNGKGLFVLDFFSEVLEGIAQTSLAYLLLAFAGGWTLIEGSITAKSEGAINPEALGEDHPSTLFIALLTVVTVLLQLLNKLILFDEFTKFHDHESWPGFILVLVRTLLAMFFTYQIQQTISFMNRRSKGSQTMKFMKSLALFGGLWFWVFPVLVVVASFFAHYLRHRIVAGGVLFLQSGCLIILTRQIAHESSAYSKASLHRGIVLGETRANA